MKSYSKGILVGISIILGSLLLMGYTSSESKIGRYQLVEVEHDVWMSGDKLTNKTVMKIDTQTGDIWTLAVVNNNFSWGKID